MNEWELKKFTSFHLKNSLDQRLTILSFQKCLLTTNATVIS